MPLAAKKQRRKVIVAGQYVRCIQYSTNTNPDVRRTRAPKTEISSVARETLNLRYSWQKLKALICANFLPSDLVIGLTYRDRDLPATRQQAENHLKLFIRHLRAERRSKGQKLIYIYVTEKGHSSGRLHHHIIVNSTGNDYDTVRKLWAKHGDDVDFSTISRRGYDGWARYLTKESREEGRRYVGERMWRSCQGLIRPQTYSGWVSRSDRLEPPPGALEIDQQRRSNIYGDFVYLEFLIPKKSENSLALISDLS